MFFRSSGAPPLSLWSPVPFGTSHIRLSSSSPWPRVGELQAVSAAVSSSSGGDLFLSYLPEFRAKSESAANPLPRSFRVRSLPLVCRSPRSAGGGASSSSSPSGPAPSASLPPVSRKPPRAGADRISHCQRSARHFGFSAEWLVNLPSPGALPLN